MKKLALVAAALMFSGTVSAVDYMAGLEETRTVEEEFGAYTASDRSVNAPEVGDSASGSAIDIFLEGMEDK